MAISLFLSGGAANTNPALSIGGAISSTAAPSNLFGPISDVQFSAGAVLYRCVYAKTDTAIPAVQVWIASETPSPNTTIAVGWGVAAINATEAAIASEVAAPAGVTFTASANKAGAPSAGDFATNQYRALWIRYTITPTALINLERFVLTVEGTLAAPASPPASPPPAPVPAPGPSPTSALVPFGDHLLTSASWGRIKGGGKILYDSLMNNAVGAGNNMVAHRFRCTTSGAASEVKLYWIAQANTNTYSGGNGGTIRIRIYPVDAANKPNLAAAHLAQGTLTPGLISGGYPAGFKFYSPCALTSVTPLVAGTLYCIVYENTSVTRSSDFMSTDDCVCVSGNEPINPWLADTDLAVLRGVGTASSASWTDETNTATETTGYTQIPNFQLKLADGTTMGHMRGEGSNTDFANRGVQASNSYPVRTKIVSPRDWTVSGFSCSVSFSVGGTMLVELKNSAGTVLQNKTITQATNHATQYIQSGETAAITTWHHVEFTAAATLLSGQTYYLQYTPQGSTRVWFNDVRDFREPTYGFASLDDLQSFQSQHNPAGTWIGFYQWAHSTDYNGSAWRDVIHLGGGGSGSTAPTNSVAPSISGAGTVGSTTTRTAGTWANFTSLTGQWLRNYIETISGATASTYVVQTADRGPARLSYLTYDLYDGGLCPSPSTQTGVRYVDAINGDETNDGLTTNTPWKKLSGRTVSNAIVYFIGSGTINLTGQFPSPAGFITNNTLTNCTLRPVGENLLYFANNIDVDGNQDGSLLYFNGNISDVIVYKLGADGWGNGFYYEGGCSKIRFLRCATKNPTLIASQNAHGFYGGYTVATLRPSQVEIAYCEGSQNLQSTVNGGWIMMYGDGEGVASIAIHHNLIKPGNYFLQAIIQDLEGTANADVFNNTFCGFYKNACVEFADGSTGTAVGSGWKLYNNIFYQQLTTFGRRIVWVAGAHAPNLGANNTCYVISGTAGFTGTTLAAVGQERNPGLDANGVATAVAEQGSGALRTETPSWLGIEGKMPSSLTNVDRGAYQYGVAGGRPGRLVFMETATNAVASATALSNTITVT